MEDLKERPPEVASEVVDAAAPATTAVAPLDPLRKIEAGLVALASERQDWDLATAAGDKAAREFRAKCVKVRSTVEGAYEELNKPLLALQRDARTMVKAITEAVKKLEEPVDALIKAEEAKVEARRAAKRAEQDAEERRKQDAERQRIDGIQARIDEIRRAATGHAKADAATLAQAIAQVELLDLTEDLYAEYLTAARRTHGETLATLRDLHDGAVHREAEAARLAAERAELQRLQAQQAEAERLAREQREAEEAAARAEQARLDAEAAEARRLADEKAAAERAEADRLAAEARAAEEARLAEQRRAQEAEQARLVAERREREAKELAERQARELAERTARETQERIAREQREAAEAAAKAQREAVEKVERERLIAEAAARTRLQSAAPKLLAALQAFLRAPSVGSNGPGSSTIVVQDFNLRAAREAITEATGEPA